MSRYLTFALLFLLSIPIAYAQKEDMSIAAETLLLEFSSKVQQLQVTNFRSTFVRSGKEIWKYEDGNSYVYPAHTMSFTFLPHDIPQKDTGDYVKAVKELQSMHTVFRELMLEHGFVEDLQNTQKQQVVLFGETLEYDGYKKGNMGCYFGVFWFATDAKIVCVNDITKPSLGTIHELKKLYDTLGFPGEYNSMVNGINMRGEYLEIIEGSPYAIGGGSMLVKKEGDDFTFIYKGDYPPCALVWQQHIPASVYEACEETDHMKEIYSDLLQKIRTDLLVHGDFLTVGAIMPNSSFYWIDGEKNLQRVKGNTINITTIMETTEEETVAQLAHIMNEIMRKEGFINDDQQSSQWYGMEPDFPELFFRGYRKGNLKCMFEGSMGSFVEDEENNKAVMYFNFSCGYGKSDVPHLTPQLDAKIRALLNFSGEYSRTISYIKQSGSFYFVVLAWRIGPVFGHILSEDQEGNLQIVFSYPPTVEELQKAGVPADLY